jgi:Uma2 family endonuclease
VAAVPVSTVVGMSTQSTQPAYDRVVDHRPRFLAAGLPADGVLTADRLHALPDDPFWKYELFDGTLYVSSDAQAITRDDLETFPDLPNWRYELLEGTLIVTPNAPSFRHQSCVGSLYILLRQGCPPDLAAIVAPFEYLPNPLLSFRPDVLLARRPVEMKRLTRTPVLVVEVLSPRTRLTDTTAKRAAYESLGVEHYWIVNPEVPSVEAFRLVNGAYDLVAKADAGEVFEVGEPVPLRFDPADLLDE